MAYAEHVEGANEATLFAFTIAFGWGEAEAMRRVSLALSDPRSRGKEREVVAALQIGADIEQALRQATPDPAPGVIPFPRSR